MNPAHIHLMLNHFPLIGFLIAFLLLVWGLSKKNQGIIKASLVTTVICGFLAVPTFFSGEGAEEIIEHNPNFQESFVEAHEEAAEFAIWFAVATTLLALSILLYAHKKPVLERKLLITLSIVQLLALATLGRTSQLGGLIAHPEIRDGQNQTPIIEDESESE